jgi:hypothetical protein
MASHILSRSNLSEKMHLMAKEVPGYAHELDCAAFKLDSAILAYVMNRDGPDKLANFVMAWGHAHAMYLEASGKPLLSD